MNKAMKTLLGFEMGQTVYVIKDDKPQKGTIVGITRMVGNIYGGQTYEAPTDMITISSSEVIRYEVLEEKLFVSKVLLFDSLEKAFQD